MKLAKGMAKLHLHPPQITQFKTFATKSINELVVDKRSVKRLQEEHSDDLVAFCSSSSLRNGRKGCSAAYAVYFPAQNLLRAEKLVGLTTNNRADCLAALEATEIANSFDPNGRKNLIIYTRYEGLVLSMDNRNGKTRWIDKWQQNGWKTIFGEFVANRDAFEALIEAERKHSQIFWRHLKAERDPMWKIKLHIYFHAILIGREIVETALQTMQAYRMRKKEEVNDKWGEFDSSTVVQLLIRHCPSLEVPDVFGEFRQLRGIKVYNTTINEWGESAAFTNTLHPGLAALYIVRVNVSDGLLPAGFQSTDFPQELYDIEICGSNLRELPDDLDTKWPPAAIIQVEYSQLKNIPSVLWRLEPYYLAVTGNPITEIPPEVFQVPGMLYLGISEMNIQELPCNVTALSPDLWYIFMGETNISFFWSWVDELVTNRKGKPPPWLAERSTYCSDLEKLQNGSAEAFAVPMSPEYSQILTNSSKENLKVITKSVKCDISIEGLFYPITIEDSNNAISTPPPLLRP
ncbi:Centrosomal protein of 41 kDa [Phytophthora boehmeriae]|uniref:ribonuclease H n=1 Tax=Phytophthora boehmeriae TaxID=109152 RepID=A0A8T1WEJ7_9STRA|nr:Centrosomal protein of 41 kDa [Phytophthora boehmeriae]